MEWPTLWDLLIEIGGHWVHSLHTQAAPSEEPNTSLMAVCTEHFHIYAYVHSLFYWYLARNGRITWNGSISFYTSVVGPAACTCSFRVISSGSL